MDADGGSRGHGLVHFNFSRSCPPQTTASGPAPPDHSLSQDPQKRPSTTLGAGAQDTVWTRQVLLSHISDGHFLSRSDVQCEIQKAAHEGDGATSLHKGLY